MDGLFRKSVVEDSVELRQCEAWFATQKR